MFEKLIESSKQKKRGRTGKYFLITCMIYAVALTVFGVMTIFWFNPNIVEAYVNIAKLIPPGPPLQSRPAAPLPTGGIANQPSAPTQFVVSDNTPVATGETVRNLPPRPPQGDHSRPYLFIGENAGPGGGGNYTPGLLTGTGTGDPAPPPRPSPTPTPTPTPAPTPVKPVLVTSQLLQGNAISKVQPPYPELAKRANVQDIVQVQVMISEDGRVLSAEVLRGHALLREAARQAAVQWRFRPTMLNNVAVPVTGVISFDFKLNR